MSSKMIHCVVPTVCGDRRDHHDRGGHHDRRGGGQHGWGGDHSHGHDWDKKDPRDCR